MGGRSLLIVACVAIAIWYYTSNFVFKKCRLYSIVYKVWFQHMNQTYIASMHFSILSQCCSVHSSWFYYKACWLILILLEMLGAVIATNGS